MKRTMVAAVAALTLVLPVTGAQAGTGDEEPPVAVRHDWVTVCLAGSLAPEAERTVRLPAVAAAVLLRVTRSYAGPCAEYGESAPRGDGVMTAYTQQEDGVPTAVGVAFTADTLEGLPDDPPTDGLWCFDKDGDGEVDPLHECAGGYEDVLELGEDFREEVDSPFTHVLMNWNPHGHLPPGVYDRPHFDVHFYLDDNAERLAIRPGTCEVLVHCDDYPLGKNLPDDKYLHEDFQDLDAVEPAMGNHLADLTSPEHHGAPFTHTLIYGVWDGEVTFYEPMVTHEWYRGLVDGSREDACFPIKQPAAWQRSGWYPTEYGTRYRDTRDEVVTSLEGFVHREAS